MGRTPGHEAIGVVSQGQGYTPAIFRTTWGPRPLIQRPSSRLVFIFHRSFGFFAVAFLLFILLPPATNAASPSKDKNDSWGAGFSVELPYAEADVVSVVQSVAEDHVMDSAA